MTIHFIICRNGREKLCPKITKDAPPSHKEGRVEHHTKRNVERDPIDQVRQDTKDKAKKLT